MSQAWAGLMEGCVGRLRNEEKHTCCSLVPSSWLVCSFQTEGLTGILGWTSRGFLDPLKL